MRNLGWLVAIGLFLVACTSSQKLMEKGQYHQAFYMAAKKLKKDASRYQEADVLIDAYKQLMDKDDQRIYGLRQEENPANWERIYKIYQDLKSRQDLVFSLPLNGIKVERRNFEEEIRFAKDNAKEYAYELGKRLLGKGNRPDARKAHTQFVKVQKFDPNYIGIDQMIWKAKQAGTVNVFFIIEDNANVVMPKRLQDDLQHIYVDDLDKQWVNYDNYIDSNKYYPYSIVLFIDQIFIGPERVNQNNFDEKKHIRDGDEYVLDANGNVKKDSLGNDMKQPRYIDIVAHVTSFEQNKIARLQGVVKYIDNKSNRVLKSLPVNAQTVFKHLYAEAGGDLRAVTKQTNSLLRIKPVNFPSNEQMVFDAGEVLKKQTKDIIYSNRNYLK